jgi:hypothetical protein
METLHQKFLEGHIRIEGNHDFAFGGTHEFDCCTGIPAKSSPIHRRLGRADHHEPRRVGADPAVERKTRRSRAEGFVDNLVVNGVAAEAPSGLGVEFSGQSRRFHSSRFAQAHSVSGKKLDAGASENTFDYCERILVSHVAADLDVADCISVECGRAREVSN